MHSGTVVKCLVPEYPAGADERSQWRFLTTVSGSHTHIGTFSTTGNRYTTVNISPCQAILIPPKNYTSNPAELCLYNDTSACSQGDVPIYAINATSPQHLQVRSQFSTSISRSSLTCGRSQAGVSFASQHDLRVSVKSSGHDYLGRSTAPNSLLLWTQYFQDIEFTDSFTVGGKDKGSAVTVGSGVGLRALYVAAKAVDKMVVGGTAATVSAGGGYTQGAGHSGFGPTFGLAADNVLREFE